MNLIFGQRRDSRSANATSKSPEHLAAAVPFRYRQASNAMLFRHAFVPRSPSIPAERQNQVEPPGGR
jgi:hypothetical protein